MFYETTLFGTCPYSKISPLQTQKCIDEPNAMKYSTVLIRHILQSDMNSIPPPTSSSPSNSLRGGIRCATTPPPPTSRPLSSDNNSDRNNNATPPTPRVAVSTSAPSTPLAPHARRPSIARSPPVGARPKDLPPGAAPLGSIPRPPHQPPSSTSSGISVPLLASQLGRPVNLGDRGNFLGPVPPLSPHHLNLLSHTLSPIAVIPTGNGKFMARNYNGTRKSIFVWVILGELEKEKGICLVVSRRLLCVIKVAST